MKSKQTKKQPTKRRTHWSRQLGRMYACPQARRYARQHPTFEDAWTACERADWLAWYAARSAGDLMPILTLTQAVTRRVLRGLPAADHALARKIGRQILKPSKVIHAQLIDQLSQELHVNDEYRVLMHAADVINGHRRAVEDVISAYGDILFEAAAVRFDDEDIERRRIERDLATLIREHIPTPPPFPTGKVRR